MNQVIVLAAVFVLARSSPVEQTVIFNEDGSYRFNFDTGKEAGSIARHEERQADGTVIGRYSYEDPNGAVRVVNYRAGRQGFIATGDVGVDGAPPSQVPIHVPPVPEQSVQEEPDQNLQPEQDPVVPEKPVEGVKQESPVEEHTEQSDKGVTQSPQDDTIKVAIPEEPGRKREAGSPPTSYSDNYYPFAAPMFGKRRLDIPEEDEKSPAEDEADKKPEPVRPPTSYVYQFSNPFGPQPEKPVEDKKPSQAPETKPFDYFYYVPVAPHYGYFPGSQQPMAQGQFQAGPPKAWAYVPLSSFPQMNSPQPAAPPTNWVQIQPHAVSYVPADGQAPAQAPVAPQVPPSNDQNSQVHTLPVQSSPTQAPVEPPPVPVTQDQNPAVPVPGQVPVQPGFHRPTVHHYHFRGPSHTYGYYYQY